MNRRDDKKYELRRIERKAKYLLMHKDIPIEKIKIVRRVLKDDTLSKDERFNSVIDLLKDCPDKAFTEVSTSKIEMELADNILPPRDNNYTATPVNLDINPTETSYFIDELYNKYRNLKCFRKRHLARSENGFGLTLQKRLVPTGNLLSLMDYLGKIQKKILPELTNIVINILEDPNADNPTTFNYIRQLQKWMRIFPCSTLNSNSVKWLQRHDFEKEFKSYISFYYSFQILDSNILSEIIEEIKSRVEMIYSKQTFKSQSLENKNSEKCNDIMSMLTFFIPHPNGETSQTAKFIRKHYSIHDLEELLSIILENLIYQRFIKVRDTVIPYFKIKEPVINRVDWDYNFQALQRVGKDADSRKQKELEIYMTEIESYDTLYYFLHIEDDGMNLLKKAVYEYISIKRKQEESQLQNNFILNLHCIMSFFKFAIAPIINGSEIEFIDKNRLTITGKLVDPSYFKEEMMVFDLLHGRISQLETDSFNNPINKNEVKKIMTGANPAMNHIEEYIKNTSNFFYSLGKEFQFILECHKEWLKSHKKTEDSESLRIPLVKSLENEVRVLKPRPVPFSSYFIHNTEVNNPLINRWMGREVLSKDLSDGLILYICSFCLQAANECYNKNIMYDLDKRMFIMRKISELKLKTESRDIRYA